MKFVKTLKNPLFSQQCFLREYIIYKKKEIMKQTLEQTKTIKAIYIDSVNKTITEMKVPDTDTFRFLRPLIGTKTRTIEVSELCNIGGNSYNIYMCEDGARNYPNINFYHKQLKGLQFYGSAFLIKVDEEGNYLNMDFDLDEVKTTFLFP